MAQNRLSRINENDDTKVDFTNIKDKMMTQSRFDILRQNDNTWVDYILKTKLQYGKYIDLTC